MSDWDTLNWLKSAVCFPVSIYSFPLPGHNRTHITYIRLLFCLFVNKFNFMTCTSLGFRRFAGIFSLTLYDLIIRNWAATNTLFRVCGVDFKWVKLWRWFTHVIYNHNHDVQRFVLFTYIRMFNFARNNKFERMCVYGGS